MKFFVNFLSVFRIVAAFAIIPLLLEQMFATSFILFVLAAVSDWLDGFLAKKFNVMTKVGGVIDHIGDKFLAATTLIMMVMFLQIWWVLVPAVLMICRDLYVSGLREFMGTQKMELPVAYGGKLKTVLQMLALAMLLLWVWAVNEHWDIDFFTFDLLFLGIGGLWIALLASLVSAGQYTIGFIKKLKKIK
jgi:CDP-diacylglycerol--glycerol-3-phosphate 3-phosphatidyltransferase